MVNCQEVDPPGGELADYEGIVFALQTKAAFVNI
jgi:hypothetical protein